MKNNQSCTVIIPAYNESGNILDAIRNASAVVKRYFHRYTLLVIDDGSSDQTAEIVSSVASKNRHIRLIRHVRNMGMGQTFRDGVKASKDTYITVFPGDNDMSADSLKDLIRARACKDIVFSYPGSSDRIRSFIRRTLSHLFTRCTNIFFGLNLRYFNGPFICKRNVLEPLQLCSRGFSIYAEVKILLIRSGATYKEIPFTHIGRKWGTSKSITPASILNTVRTMGTIFFKLHTNSYA
jgi:glycosyltransferase involved in cell wall biosynthesis